VAIAEARVRLEERIAATGPEAEVWVKREPLFDQRVWEGENPRNDALAVVDTDEI